jgi:hypothetical protein
MPDSAKFLFDEWNQFVQATSLGNATAKKLGNG